MMSESLKTGLFAGVAAALIGAASWVEPDAYKTEIFSDTGQVFFPNFRDAGAVKAIEVVAYDEAEAAALPLKVEFRQNRWLLTSHGDYPAEARDRMAKTAAALLDLKKDEPVSDRFEDHGSFGVIDPLDAKNPSFQGRGKRVTLRDAQGVTLAELILGKPVKDKAGLRYVRLPGQKRTYAVKTDADPSARFEDWVEADLLKAGYNDIAKLTLSSYQVDEQFGRLMNPRRLVMVKDKENWDATAKSIAQAVGSLRVAGARPKPKVLAQQLRDGQLALTLDMVMSLRQRGFFITPMGQLLANEGELSIETVSGVNYTVRFGEVVSDGTAKQRENRFVFITASSRTPESEARAKALQSKFADWYYVISGADFKRLHPESAAAKGTPPAPRLPPGFPPEMLPPGVRPAPGEARPPAQGAPPQVPPAK